MTSDRSRKRAARARKAATGEPYTQARRAVGGSRGRPAEEAEPPAIDPREHAIESYDWDVVTCYVVHYQDRYYAWIASPGDRPQVYAMPDEAAGRRFADRWQTANLLRSPWNEHISRIFLLDPVAKTRIIYHAAVLNVADSGIWLACEDSTAEGEPAVTLKQFDDMGGALGEFAACAERAAGQVEHEQSVGSPDLIAGVLRYRAAQARADVARAVFGDTVRRQHADAGPGDGLAPVWHEAGIPSERLGEVVAGREWAWPQGPVVRPPGRQLPDTPVTTLAEHVVDGHQFRLFSYLDSQGRKCVAIDLDGHGAPVTDVAVDEEHLINAGMAMPTRGHGVAAVYGRAHESVTELFARMKDGSQVDWPVYDDPRNQERYFTVIADCDALDDIVAVAPSSSTSLKDMFGIWFSQPPDRGSSGRSSDRPDQG